MPLPEPVSSCVKLGDTCSVEARGKQNCRYPRQRAAENLTLASPTHRRSYKEDAACLGYCAAARTRLHPQGRPRRHPPGPWSGMGVEGAKNLCLTPRGTVPASFPVPELCFGAADGRRAPRGGPREDTTEARYLSQGVGPRPHHRPSLLLHSMPRTTWVPLMCPGDKEEDAAASLN